MSAPRSSRANEMGNEKSAYTPRITQKNFASAQLTWKLNSKMRCKSKNNFFAFIQCKCVCLCVCALELCSADGVISCTTICEFAARNTHVMSINYRHKNEGNFYTHTHTRAGMQTLSNTHIDEERIDAGVHIIGAKVWNYHGNTPKHVRTSASTDASWHNARWERQ